ncbi:metal-dependent phosphohydrolase [Blastococcus sp. MG754426]|uniref:HD domain-containing protein n=1 Tax=unclassified Blastococcus TaxID=2619396 RepID=UPI001EF0A59C|nr:MULTISPECIES: metal-dependent phosphohydrolase [unclassified Blastococcus]MCF6506176.1 metal-dependent phosphohydrolase [Blastococcus sp. MG754426]MCF6510446.1 metal-dependent phosphohydrolase [Blastococcus sp. MG754427]MCF6735579.1 metal-dependent phosphohydrolase [Blastococcus sp. KM273129]
MSGPVGFEAWAALAGDSPISRTEWAAVVAAWSEPHRRYHDLAHLAAVLGLVERLSADAPDPAAVALAAWYHDVVYDPLRADNEQVSADRARAGLRGLVPEERVEEVARLVLLTAAHDPEPGDVNGAALCDADLAVLAAPPAAYAGYASAVRAEYGHLSDEDFTAGRIAVLERLLELPRLYRLPAAAEWEQPARANLTAEITLLRQRAGEASGA